MALMTSMYDLRGSLTSISVSSDVSVVLDSDTVILPISFTFDALLLHPDLYTLILARHFPATPDSCSCCVLLVGE